MAPRKRIPGRLATIERDPAWQPPIELRQRIHALAGRWTRDRWDVREDLEQEALLAIWLKGETKAPLSHQLQTAQHRMLSVRKLGKSVDGKLDSTYKRSTMYLVLSMEQQGIGKGDSLLPFQDLLPSPSRVEEYIVAKLTVLEILDTLEPEEHHCVLLLCQGFTMQEIAARSRCPLEWIRRCLTGAREKLRPLMNEGSDDWYPSSKRPANGAVRPV
jgi:DNA-directed RNA polymerase specialized sigma24 family protein